jgi:hypothetical protein
VADTTIPLPDLPAAISRAQCLAALDALGLPHNVRSLTMDAYGITLTLLAQTEDGHFIHAGDDAVCITVHLPHAEEGIRTSTPLTQDQADELRQKWKAAHGGKGPNHSPVVP